MRNESKLTRAKRFFYKHAGYSVKPGETNRQGRERSAKALARAEAHAKAQDWSYDWEIDDDGCIGCDCKSPDCRCSSGEPHETLVCFLRGTDETVLTSLGGICGATPEYRRVIEAELALETMGS